MISLILLFIFIAIVITTLITCEVFGMWNFHKMIYGKNYGNVEYNTIPKSERENLKKGKEISLSKRIIFTGLTRDSSKRIKKNVEALSKIGESFNDYRIILFENDSKDGTREIIEKMALSNPKIELIECEEAPRCKLSIARESGLALSRMEKMSSFRNRLLDYTKCNYSDFDYLMMCDLDMEGVFYRNGVLHSVGLMQNYSAVFARGVSPQPLTFGMMNVPYDALAYLEEKDDPSAKVNRVLLFKKMLKQFWASNFTNKPVSVKSAFNGAGIYTIKDIDGMKYNGNCGCEHYSLNCALHEKGKKLCINPVFTFFAGNQGMGNF